MRRFLGIIAVIAIVLAAAPASAIEPFGLERQETDVLTFADLEDVGDALLRRTESGVGASVVVEGLEPGDVLTSWWVVWNTPEGCDVAYACVEADLFNPEAGLAIGYGGGSRVDTDGRFVLSSVLYEGDALHGFPYPEFMALGVELTESTLVDTDTAEIHLVLRNHGAPPPGAQRSALTTFNGGCVYEAPITGIEPAYGIAGTSTCVDELFVIFPSPIVD